MKIVIGNYSDPTDERNLILNEEVKTSDKALTFALISKVEGLETAPYRNGTGDWSGADGGYISSQLFSARTITISGVYIDRQAGCDYSTASMAQFDHLARLYIRSRLPIRTKQYIRIFTDSGMTFYTEGYCVDIKMDLTYIGYGEYQITMYCPDPALYRGDQDGTLGSEWNTATLRKHNDVGFVSSEMTNDGVSYAHMEYSATLPDNNKGIVWGTGGRSTPVEYTGDFPYYPQFIVSPSAGQTVTNPAFYSVTEDKFFGLGYPNTDAAKFEVASVDANGAITSLNILNAGAYEADYSANGVVLQSVSYVEAVGRTEYGAGATVNLSATPNGDLWEFSTATIKDGGAHYMVGDVVTPQIAGATILQVHEGQTLVIDMAEHTALLDGQSVAYYITPGSEWFQLEALAANNIVFATANVDDGDSAKIRWRNGYLGI